MSKLLCVWKLSLSWTKPATGCRFGSERMWEHGSNESFIIATDMPLRGDGSCVRSLASVSLHPWLSHINDLPPFCPVSLFPISLSVPSCCLFSLLNYSSASSYSSHSPAVPPSFPSLPFSHLPFAQLPPLLQAVSSLSSRISLVPSFTLPCRAPPHMRPCCPVSFLVCPFPFLSHTSVIESSVYSHHHIQTSTLFSVKRTVFDAQTAVYCLKGSSE